MKKHLNVDFGDHNSNSEVSESESFKTDEGADLQNQLILNEA